MGKIFELISRQYLLDLQGQNRLPCYFGEIGRWWGGNPVTRRQDFSYSEGIRDILSKME